MDRDKDARILINAQSNFACDEIAVRLLKYVSRGKIYRHYSRRFEAKTDTIPSELVEISNLSKNCGDFLTVEQFYGFNVIISTLMSSSLFMESKKQGYFDYIFIDESGAATEPELLIPIAGFGMNFNEIKSSIILLGGEY